LGAFAGFMVKWALTHLESDLSYSRNLSQRGAKVAERAADVVEQRANGS
jgi:hypothetical protein